MNFSEVREDIRNKMTVDGTSYEYFDLSQLTLYEEFQQIANLPFSIKALLESAIRQFDGRYITESHIHLLANWQQTQTNKEEIPFKPARIVLQDFTGIPAIVDLASMRNAVHEVGGNVENINPQVPVDLVIDHSLIVEKSGSEEAFQYNLDLEYERNEERYRFVRWAQKSFDHFRVVPPASGIVHQVNLEHLATSVVTSKQNGTASIYLDSVIGTDSHTPMINGLGTIGWGVGGIEAEAAMLGKPLYLVIPEVIGVKLTGTLPEGATATDIALTVTSRLRKHGVVGKFVEFFGTSLSKISVADRATIANMAPEYGATMAFFPTDEATMEYLRVTGREQHVKLSKAYHQAQGLYLTGESAEPSFTEVLEIDLTQIVPTLAGPKRPQDQVPASEMKKEFYEALHRPIDQNGYGFSAEEAEKSVLLPRFNTELKTGDLVLAAITSCTNTSNPSVMIAAGLVAKKAVEKGIVAPSYVKKTIAPGSRVVTKYLESSGLLRYLEQIGFYIDGYGCAVCCGNTGAFDSDIEKAIVEHDLLVASILSGNRNFEGRVHPLIKANYLASPPLVVVYALAGKIGMDIMDEPLGLDANGRPVFFHDIWPSSEEIEAVISKTVTPSLFEEQYANVFENTRWNALPCSSGSLYPWETESTYIQKAPFFESEYQSLTPMEQLEKMNALLFLGDSITTDHISPVGQIGVTSPAGRYLADRGVSPRQFNSYGSRRGNHNVMIRGTFSNVRLRNKLADGKEGGFTKFLPTSEVMSVYDAAMRYHDLGKNLLIIAGKEYGTGSSRDWAAKGTKLLGVKAVLAESFERIHRSNLVGMGVLPLQFKEGESAETWHLEGTENFTIVGVSGEELNPFQQVTVIVERAGGITESFEAVLRLDSDVEVEYFTNGGILQSVMQQFLQNNERDFSYEQSVSSE